ncbi:MAG: hypothetical protein E3K40_11760 [Candidatus Brocadia sp.]|nr:hypothetical protein [Candidatus Brocadia sp.]
MLKGLFMVKTKGFEIEKKAEIALRKCLERVPFLKIESLQKEFSVDDFCADFLVTLVLFDSKQNLVVEVKNNGQPRVAREAVNTLLRYKNADPDFYGVFMAPYISLQAAEICSKDGIGYIDLAGNCRLSFGRVYIEQAGNPNPFREKRDLRSLYSPKAARILRVLLINPKRVWKTQGMAKEAEVSLGQVANVKKFLEDREWILVTAEGFSLREPEKLLKEWSENYTFKKNQPRNFYSLKNSVELEEYLARVCNERGIKYALTGFSGAVRFAPAVRYQRAMAYVSDNFEDVASVLNLKEVPSGANLTVLTPYDEGVFYGTRLVGGIRVASPVQIYLDLVSFRGRGEEAAHVLLEEAIKPTW